MMRQRTPPSRNGSAAASTCNDSEFHFDNDKNPLEKKLLSHGSSSSSSSKSLSPVLVQTGCFIAMAILLLVGLKYFLPETATSMRSSSSYQQPTFDLKSGHHPFTPVPKGLERTFWVEQKKINQAVTRAWRDRGWTKVNNVEDARAVWTYSDWSEYYKELKPWQRYNHMSGYHNWNAKDDYVKGFGKYANEHPEKDFYFNPPSYRLAIQEERDAFKHVLRKEGGEKYPWVLKRGNVNQGKGITMLGPHTEELIHVLRDNPRDEDSDLIIQKYICHEDTWNGRKYDVRMFWLVASLDPLIVMYHDGYVRIGNGKYDESDFSDTRQHLTTHTKLAEEGKATFKEFEEHVKELAKTEGLTSSLPTDPVSHVRNQFKEAIGETVAAFKEKSFNVNKHNTENGIGFYGADFVLDKDLDVWFLEPQSGCGMDEDYMFRVEMHDQMYTTMVDIVSEIWDKQDAQKAGVADQKQEPLLPLKKPGFWEYVFVDDWVYKYEGYERSKNKEGCTNTKL
eukprot:CAMPEP_0194032770 /NCGR_PEP_ID=MMETSP0009_2-20130614/5640_1 /TAXON_ID=210454 /ORGANISM="Grammatophora oceanica, Strain CCMP 410" /LENGTH=506 /DNA_ID=CAMNT_0038673307 /DNA_START=63 /DNA_END=1583 /DNA_ORIENTATION=+